MNTPIENEPQFHIKLASCDITVLGTAHISKTSADQVRMLVESGQFDAVAIELCPSRYQAIIDPDALSKMDIFQVIQKGKAAMVAASLALGAYQQRLAEQLDIKPGAEFHAAIESARNKKLPVILLDREIGTTLKRIYHNVPWWKRMSLITGLLASLLARHEVSEEEIERLKEGDMLESIFSQFAAEAQSLYVPLIDERDHYMSARLSVETHETKHQHILAVVGAGHLKGMKQYLEKYQTDSSPQTTQENIDRLDVIPTASRWPKLIPWAIVALIITGFTIGFSRSTDLGIQMVIEWVVINGGLAALGALIAAAHPITILGAFCAAPITSLNPMVGAGMATAAIELYIRKPTVADFVKLRTDTCHIKGWWKNRVSRTLLIFLLSTIGSAVGTYLAGYLIFERLTAS